MNADMEKLREALRENALACKRLYSRTDLTRGQLREALAEMESDLRQALALSPSSGEGDEEPMPWNEIDRAVALARWTLQDHEAFKLHPTTAKMVRNFAFALAQKLRAAEEKYGYSDGWRTLDWEAECQRQLHAHADKGDPLDVAAYAAFCWARRWSTELPPTAAPAAAPVSPALAEEVARIIDPTSFDYRTKSIDGFHVTRRLHDDCDDAIQRALETANAIIPVVLKAFQGVGAGEPKQPTTWAEWTAGREDAGPEPEWWPLRQYGYAPGGYVIICCNCTTQAWDCDKRAVSCRPCAEKRLAAPTQGEPS